MPRFFIHVQNRTSYTRDTEGEELENVGAAYASALRSCAEIAAEDILRGEKLIELTFEIDDEGGARVGLIPIRAVIGGEMGAAA